MQTLELLETHASFKSEQRKYKGYSETLGRELEVMVFVPVAQLKGNSSEVIYYLPSLQTNARLVASQSDYQRYAERYDMMVVIPDIFAPYGSREDSCVGSYWREREQMAQFLLHELPQTIEREFNTFSTRGIMGYGFGGTLAMNLAIAHPLVFRSVSALAPWIGFWGTPWCTEHLLPEGIEKTLDPAVAFLEGNVPDRCPPIWVDQGTKDEYLGTRIQPERIAQLFGEHVGGERMWYRWHKRFNHSFYFVHSQIRQHFVFHANVDEEI